jgi:predicted amidophosphoribosyltransferase
MRWWANVQGMTVCIVDNLLVTGATVCEVSKVLRKAGAKKIYAAVAARTVSGGDFQAADEAVAAVGD